MSLVSTVSGAVSVGVFLAFAALFLVTLGGVERRELQTGESVRRRPDLVRRAESRCVERGVGGEGTAGCMYCVTGY